MNRITERIRTWFNANREQITVGFDRVGEVIGEGVEVIARIIGRLIIVGFVLNIINNFYPGFSEKFPTIYGWFNGWTEFAEFAYKVAIKGISALLTGELPEFWADYKEALNALWETFKAWSATITF